MIPEYIVAKFIITNACNLDLNTPFLLSLLLFNVDVIHKIFEVVQMMIL